MAAALFLLALSAPRAGAEERVFYPEDHGLFLTSSHSILCLASGNVWTYNADRGSRFDGLTWQESYGTFYPPAVDNLGGLWWFFDGGIGQQAFHIDSRSGLRAQAGLLYGGASRIVYSDSDSAFLAQGGDTLRAFPWTTDPFAARPYFVFPTPLATPPLPPSS